MLVPAYIDTIKFNKDYNNYIVSIKNNLQDNAFFSFVITSSEAKKISLSKSNVTSNKLNIYDLFINFTTMLGYEIKKTNILSRNKKAHSQIFLKSKSKKIVLDSFLVDSLIISMKTFSPLYVDEKLFIQNKNIFYSEKEIFEKSKSVVCDKENNIEKLNSSLIKLIEKEKYELAAIIRDRINEIKKD
tara:strand:- start:455 stop:1015 length:561 start_codon:yes stop_codon:yes gene_type:complete